MQVQAVQGRQGKALQGSAWLGKALSRRSGQAKRANQGKVRAGRQDMTGSTRQAAGRAREAGRQGRARQEDGQGTGTQAGTA
jgi:hypothetical protein